MNTFSTLRIKFLLVFIILLQGFTNQSKAQLVLVPDSNLRAKLIFKGFGSCFTGNYIDSTCALVQNCTNLTISNGNIQTLQGLEAFTNLTNLDCSNNQITTLPPLSNTLADLYCQSNKITTIPNYYTNLVILNCSTNLLTTLSGLPNTLNYLDCRYNQIASISSFPSALTYAELTLNNLTSLPPLPNSLGLLECDINQISTIPTLPSTLYNFNCNSNLITTLPSVLPSGLLYFQCNQNQITSLPALPPNLITLACWSNKITLLPALPNTLQVLDCGNNLFTPLPATLPPLLTALGCQSLHLTTLPPLPNSLSYLACSGNALTSLPPLPQSLRMIFCSQNFLNLVPSLPDTLDYFDCSYNLPLTCLPKINVIGQLDFTNTSITCLPNYGNVTTSTPLLSTVPLCGYFTPNQCTGYWNISGKTYFDADNNCQFSLGDVNESNFKINLFKNGILKQSALSGTEGFYSFDTDSLGTYTVTLDTTDIPYLINCPLSLNYTDTLDLIDSLKYNNDFALKCKNGFDLAAWSIYTTGLRPGHQVPVKVSAGDYSELFGTHCASGVSGSVTIILTGPIHYLSPDSAALTPTVTGDTLTYSIIDFGSVDFAHAFNFIVSVDTFALNGSPVAIQASISPVNDNNPTNNIVAQNFVVHGSFDPNEKTVYPQNTVDINGDRWLTYSIAFQNTGSAPAENIYVIDTLNANLDLSSFTLLGYSHKPYVQILAGGIARFNFPNINLPDSTSDEHHSHGYVQYKIKANAGVTNGTQLNNTAYIYFDYNAPVVTNTVTNTVLNCPANSTTITVSSCGNYNFNGLILSQSGIYTRTYHTSVGCDSVVHLNLTVQLANTLHIAHDTLFSDANNASYQWINCANGSHIAGATHAYYIPTTSGSYAVILTSGNCSDTSTCQFFSMTGIKENNLSAIKVFPNPFKNNFTINCPFTNSANQNSIMVFDIFGRVVDNEKLLSGKTIIDASKWNNGVYLLHIMLDGERVVQKLVKE